MVVQTLEDTVFYVYGLPDFDFRYAQGRRGEGPDEFLSPIAMLTGGEDVFSVRTYRGGQRTMELYRVWVPQIPDSRKIIRGFSFYWAY